MTTVSQMTLSDRSPRRTVGAAQASEELFGLQHVRDPRLIIVVGRAEALPDHCARVLRQFNKSLHRVEIVPFDVLARRANAILDNVERYLLAIEQSEDEEDDPAVNGT